MTTTTWLLDVDGVLNANKPRGWGCAPYHATLHADGHTWKFRWNPRLLDAIRDLTTHPGLDIQWCTTWCRWPAELERAFRLPQLECALRGDTHAEAKRAAARAVLAAGQRLIWTDDEAVPEPGTNLHTELNASGRALLLRPPSNRGLAPTDLDQIHAFLDQ